MRLDAWLVAEGKVPSRARAVALVESGGVEVNGRVAVKASLEITGQDVVAVVGEDHGYVSRSALKLKALLEAVRADLRGKVVLDVGASTGGFTQVCLEWGAAKVYAVDVGTGQLHEQVRADARVVDMSRTDARELSAGMFDPVPEVLVADVSFISLGKILPSVAAMPGGCGRCMSSSSPSLRWGGSWWARGDW